MSNSVKLRKNNKPFNESIMHNTDDAEELFDIFFQFDEDAESRMIFIFVSCIIALVAFILLVFLCFKHERLRKIMSLYITSPTAITAAMDSTSCSTSDIFMYILSTICILILMYVIIKLFIRGCQHFHRYQTTTHFLCEHRYDKGPSTAVALKLSTMSEITHVHIAHLNILITRLSVHEKDHNAYYIVTGNWFYDFLKLSQHIILLLRNGVIPIRTPITFKIGFFQSFQLCRMLCTDYLARVVAFQNGYMIPLSRIQVCHSSSPVAPFSTLVAATPHPEPVATPSGLYPSHPIPEHLEITTIHPTPVPNVTIPSTASYCTY